MTNASVVEEPEVGFDYSAEAELFPARNRRRALHSRRRPTAYIAAHASKWRSRVHGEQWIASLENDSLTLPSRRRASPMRCARSTRAESSAISSPAAFGLDLPASRHGWVHSWVTSCS
jgi:hypothetical protein